jgi:hypothetical protein
MNYNHITYGQQKFVSRKKTEATLRWQFYHARISDCRRCDTPFYCSGYVSNAGYGLPSFSGRFLMVMRPLSDSGRIRTLVKRVLLSCGPSCPQDNFTKIVENDCLIIYTQYAHIQGYRESK